MLLNPNKPYKKFGHEVCTLPEKELVIAFEVLLMALSIADNRRKQMESCGGCNHWWHKDLSDETYIKTLLNDDS